MRNIYDSMVAGNTIIARENMENLQKLREYKVELDTLKEEGKFNPNEGLTEEEMARLKNGLSAQPTMMEHIFDMDETSARLGRERKARIIAGEDPRILNPDHIRGVIILKEKGAHHDAIFTKTTTNN